MNWVNTYHECKAFKLMRKKEEGRKSIEKKKKKLQSFFQLQTSKKGVAHPITQKQKQINNRNVNQFGDC